MNIHLNTLVEAEVLTEELANKLERAAALLLREHGLEKGEVGIILADNAYLRRLNRTYRGKDTATDVLAFGLLDPGERERAAAAAGDPVVAVGDVYISVERAAEQAGEAGHSLQREILLLAVHGLLHLLGYDHDDDTAKAEMQAWEAAMLSRLE